MSDDPFSRQGAQFLCNVKPGTVLTQELGEAISRQMMLRGGEIPPSLAEHIVEEHQPPTHVHAMTLHEWVAGLSPEERAKIDAGIRWQLFGPAE